MVVVAVIVVVGCCDWWWLLFSSSHGYSCPSRAKSAECLVQAASLWSLLERSRNKANKKASQHAGKQAKQSKAKQSKAKQSKAKHLSKQQEYHKEQHQTNKFPLIVIYILLSIPNKEQRTKSKVRTTITMATIATKTTISNKQTNSLRLLSIKWQFLIC